MKAHTLLSILLALLLPGISAAQVCTFQNEIIAEEKSLDKDWSTDLFQSVLVTVNGIELDTQKPSTQEIPLHSFTFDTLSLHATGDIGENYSQTFLCKLQENATYTVQRCEGYGKFQITPATPPETGMVKVENTSGQEFLLLIGREEPISVPAKGFAEVNLPAPDTECPNKYTNIVLAHPEYADPKYDGSQESGVNLEVLFALEDERATHIKYSQNYLFLNGETLQIIIHESGSRFKLRLNEY